MTSTRYVHDQSGTRSAEILNGLVRDGFIDSWVAEPIEPLWSRSYPNGSQWFILATEEDRDVALDALWLTWVELADRCTLLNYALMWKDVQGFGLEVAHADWAGHRGSIQR